jgi:hypothetical protein
VVTFKLLQDVVKETLEKGRYEIKNLEEEEKGNVDWFP